MKINDILLNESIANIVEEIKSSKWFKTANYNLYRGMNHKINTYEKVSIKKDNTRKPRNTSQESHDAVNKLSIEKLGLPVRNSLYITTDITQAKIYGEVYMVFPVGDNNILLTNPAVRDMYTKQPPVKEYVDGIVDVSNNPDVSSKTEIMFFGDAYIMTIELASKYGLIKRQENTKLVERFLHFIETDKNDDAVEMYVVDKLTRFNDREYIDFKNIKKIIKALIMRFKRKPKRLVSIVSISESKRISATQIIKLFDIDDVISILKYGLPLQNRAFRTFIHALNNKELLKHLVIESNKIDFFIIPYIDTIELILNYTQIQLSINYGKVKTMLNFISEYKTENAYPNIIKYAMDNYNLNIHDNKDEE